ncbi:contractile injection system tape measure protein [Aquimarina sp. SS2-1]|uniref:contractile injection system tape measure protein n=1 Tax=Aquimarina besae TaxID=3342247 RepID=UPI00366FB031
MVNKKHIINKIFFEVNTPDTKTAYYLKDHLDVFLKQDVLPTIQNFFDGLSATADNQIQRFEKLELHINSKDVKDQLQLQLAIIKSLQKQIAQAKSETTFEEKEKGFSAITKEKSEVETFFYFLRTGQNPWWDSERDIKDNSFLETLVSSKIFKDNLSESLANPYIRQRLIYQFSDEVLIRFFNRSMSNPHFPIILRNSKVREQYWTAVAGYIINPDIQSLQRAMVKIFNELSKDHKLEKNVYGVVTKEIIQVFDDIQKDTRFQYRINPEQFLKTKKVLMKTVEKIVSDQFRTIQKEVNKVDVFKSLTNEGLRKEFKGLLDISFLDQTIVRCIKRALDVVDDTLQEFKKEIIHFTSELISEKLELLEYHTVKISDESIALNQHQEFNREEAIEQDAAIYIKNAGLVVLHPYLNRFFSTLKLLKENGKIKPEKVETAIHLLHYLATKIECQSENELVFEKFLCGYPLYKPIRKNVRLSEKMKEEAENLLKATINNWTALKNTSPDGLRENFIKRSGKLILDDPAKYRVVVERKTQDILLEKLPWNITILKLTWIDRLVFVEW